MWQLFKVKPFKELLKGLNGSLKINIDIVGGVDFYGAGGFNGRINQIPWHMADMIIKEVHASDPSRTYVDIQVELEA